MYYGIAVQFNLKYTISHTIKHTIFQRIKKSEGKKMKYKTTKKAIKEEYKGKYILTIPYCNLQTLLRLYEPFAYSERAEGWACDYYGFYHKGEAICISTGYAPIEAKKVSYELTRKYEKLAMEIFRNTFDYEKQKIEIASLLTRFFNEVYTK